MWQTDRAITYNNVLSWSSLNIDVFWSFTKTSVERKVKFEANLFQTKLLSPLSHKACHLLCSSVLLHKFTFDTSKPKNTVSSKFQYESGTTPHTIMPQCVWEKKTSKKYSATSETTVKEISNIIILKHQWDTRWVFMRKHHIFPRENNVLMLIFSVFQIYFSGVIYEMWTFTNNPGCPLCKKMLWFLSAF